MIPVIGRDGEITEVYGRKLAAGDRSAIQYHSYLPGPHRGVWNSEAMESPDVILCEALIDALSFWVNGLRNVTASYGVEGFTKDHLAGFLKGGVKKVYIAYDRDHRRATRPLKSSQRNFSPRASSRCACASRAEWMRMILS